MKRIILFLITNLAIMFLMMVVFHVVCAFMGIDPSGAMGGDLYALAIFSLIFGMAGGIISLLIITSRCGMRKARLRNNC